jgi:hypothetical protein
LTASGASIQARLIDYWSVKGLKIRFDRDASLHLDPKP